MFLVALGGNQLPWIPSSPAPLRSAIVNLVSSSTGKRECICIPAHRIAPSVFFQLSSLPSTISAF